jgi:lysophospholipase L1-like esterase
VFGAAEGMLRLLNVPDPGLFDGDPAFLWTLRPNLDREMPFPEMGGSFSVRTSADGYRDESMPQDTLWIAAMGCSTTFGWGVAEHQAWPAVLEQVLGVPVLNGGVPGYSTHQALRTIGPVLAAEPALVIYSYLVRDAQLGARADKRARRTPWLGRTHLVRLLTRALSGRDPASKAAGGTVAGGVPRVDARDYASNLRQLVERTRTVGSEAMVLVFPMQERPLDHLLSLEQVDVAQVAPRLPNSAFFAGDPLHLTPDGHRLLVQAIESSIRAILVGEPVVPVP